MRDIAAELKELRLHGMVGAWTDLMAQGPSSTQTSRRLIEHLLQAETTDRCMRGAPPDDGGQVPPPPGSGGLQL